MSLSDMNGEHGPCLKCGYEEELDNTGHCYGCNPRLRSHAEIIIKKLASERRKKENDTIKPAHSNT